MRAFGVLGIVVALTASAARGGPPADQPSLEALVGLYRSGMRDKAAAVAALWDRDTLEAQTRRLVYAASARSGDSGREELLLGGAALLTESALLDVLTAHAQRARWELHSAADLVEAAPPGSHSELFARRFYLVGALGLHRVVELEAAHELLVEGLGRYPDDPELLTALASISETVASLRRYELPPASRDRVIHVAGSYATEGQGGGSLPGASLGDAEADYVKALGLAPDLLEARLRLARVRSLRGQPEQALPDLERVAAESTRTGQRYLARLFEGRVREQLGDAAGAAVAYREATEAAPRAQTGLLALGRALDRIGDAAGAQQALDRASEPGFARDPWWSYQAGQPERIQELVLELRGLAR